MTKERSLSVDFIKLRPLDAEIKLKLKNQAVFMSSYSCGRPGHRAADCRIKGPSYHQRGSHNSFRGRDYNSHRGRASDHLFFTAFSAIQFNNYDENNIRFIIDSGATENLIKDTHLDKMYLMLDVFFSKRRGFQNPL